MADDVVDVAVVGASGYAARELFRILAGHRRARVTVATSRQGDANRVEDLHPSLRGRIALACEPFDADAVARRAAFAFLGLPHTASLEVVPALRRRGVKVIDLSADYRLKDPQVYADWYGHPHTDPEGLLEAVYGLPELYREEVSGASLIANPGCYTSTSILALAPLVAADLIERDTVIIDAKSGVSGAGRVPKPSTLYSECNENFSAYSVGRHRHTPEIDQVLTAVGRAGGRDAAPVEVVFTPHLAPMDRGIFATIYARPKHAVGEHEILDLFRSFYRESPFVRVVDGLPTTKDSAFTNFFDVTARLVRGRIVILACLDNLVKGAAGVAVQNFNLMIGADEAEGLH